MGNEGCQSSSTVDQEKRHEQVAFEKPEENQNPYERKIWFICKNLPEFTFNIKISRMEFYQYSMKWLIQNAIDYFHLAYPTHYINTYNDDIPIKTINCQVSLSKQIQYYFDSTPFYFEAQKRPDPHTLHLRLAINTDIVDCWCHPDDTVGSLKNALSQTESFKRKGLYNFALSLSEDNDEMADEAKISDFGMRMSSKLLVKPLLKLSIKNTQTIDTKSKVINGYKMEQPDSFQEQACISMNINPNQFFLFDEKDNWLDAEDTLLEKISHGMRMVFKKIDMDQNAYQVFFSGKIYNIFYQEKMRVEELQKVISSLSRTKLKGIGNVQHRHKLLQNEETIEKAEIKPGSKVYITYNNTQEGTVIFEHIDTRKETKVAFKQTDCILDIKAQYAQIQGIHPWSISIKLNDKQLEDDALIEDEEIGDQTKVYVETINDVKYVGDFTETESQTIFVGDADVCYYRGCLSGLNCEARCQNEHCELFQKFLVIPIYVGKECFDFQEDNKNFKCPVCHFDVYPEYFTAHLCDYRIFGILQDTVTKDEFKYFTNWKRVDEESYSKVYLDAPPGKQWVSQKIVIREIDQKIFIPICFICLENIGPNEWQYGQNCQHSMHVFCIKQGGNIFEGNCKMCEV